MFEFILWDCCRVSSERTKEARSNSFDGDTNVGRSKSFEHHSALESTLELEMVAAQFKFKFKFKSRSGELPNACTSR